MKYMYDLHCHSKEGSTCSNFPVKEMVNYYKEQGFDGFCITDHFTGSSTVPEGALWEDRVNKIWEILAQAQSEAEKVGITVFPALEFSIRASKEEFLPAKGNDFIFLGLSKEWLLENEAVFNLEFDELCDKVHEGGGFIIHAHPFLEAWYIKSVILYPDKEDAVEIYNAHASEKINNAAAWYAEHYGKPVTAGSDNHCAGEPFIAGIETNKKCETVLDLIEEIKNKRAIPFMRKSK